MTSIDRRSFIGLAGGVTALGMLGMPLHVLGAPKARVVVIGGGYGGAIAAKYLRLADPGIEVTLIEQNKKFVSCPLSNEVLSGEASIDSLSFGYGGLEARGVKLVFDAATAIDPQKRRVTVKGGKSYDFDFAVVSPGVEFKWGAIEGYDEAASQVIPHAWKAGPQTLLLRKQIEAMRDGGTVFIVAPPNPFRCPPGPYERAAQIALYFKHHKPRSKVVILDAKDAFSKQALFQQGWDMHYPGMISWVGAAGDGKVQRVDVKSRKLFTEFGEHQGDVINIIPAQKAGPIAQVAGLTDQSGWCPVNQKTFESSLHKSIYVIGDSCASGPMPKSAYSANTQGKVCAAAIVARVRGEPEPEPAYANTCYSLITPDHGISVAHVFRLVDGKITEVKGSGGVSPIDATAFDRRAEATYARSWFKNITAEMFT
jgi:sulfide dehydrogenase [flavocytochrome c] flavoprotein subunit